MKSELVTVANKQLFVEDTESSAAPVVMMHGLGGTTSFYEPLVPAFAERHRVVRFDFDGHGRSPLSGPISVSSLAEDLGAVIERLPAKKAHVVAHSLGTLVAQELAAKRPELVGSLVLLGPIRAQAEAAKTATRARAALVREKGMAAVADTIAQNATSAEARSKNQLVAALVRELLLAQAPESYARACEALASADNPALSAIVAPTLLLSGDDDKVSTEAVRDEMKKTMANVESFTTKGCGHWTAIEAPAFVVEHALAFLGKL